MSLQARTVSCGSAGKVTRPIVNCDEILLVAIP